MARDTDIRLVTIRDVWKVANNCVSAGDEPTALGVDERTFQTIDAAITAAQNGDEKITFYDVPDGANSVMFTAIGITNDDDYSVDIYSGTLGTTVSKARGDSIDCDMTHIGTLAFIFGLQESSTSGSLMAQSVTATSKDSTATLISKGTVDSDRTCEASIDLQGADVLVIVPTICDSDSKLLAKGF